MKESKCNDEIVGLLYDFLDGEIDGTRQKVLFEHLAICHSCQQELDLQLAFRNAIRHEHLAVPEAVDNLFFSKLDNRKANNRQKRSIDHQPLRRIHITVSLQMASIAAALLILIGFIFWFQKPDMFKTQEGIILRQPYVLPGVIVESEATPFVEIEQEHVQDDALQSL